MNLNTDEIISEYANRENERLRAEVAELKSDRDRWRALYAREAGYCQDCGGEGCDECGGLGLDPHIVAYGKQQEGRK